MFNKVTQINYVWLASISSMMMCAGTWEQTSYALVNQALLAFGAFIFGIITAEAIRHGD